MLTLLSPAKTLDFDTPPTTAKATWWMCLNSILRMISVR